MGKSVSIRVRSIYYDAVPNSDIKKDIRRGRDNKMVLYFSKREWGLGLGFVWGTLAIQLRIDLLCVHCILFIRRKEI